MPAVPLFAAIGSAVGASAATAAATGVVVAGSTLAAGFSIAGAAGAFSKNPQSSNINPNPTATPAQTVDPSTSSSTNNLGRAALIMTSPQGVQGTDPTNKYALLGNQSGLGN